MLGKKTPHFSAAVLKLWQMKDWLACDPSASSLVAKWML